MFVLLGFIMWFVLHWLDPAITWWGALIITWIVCYSIGSFLRAEGYQ